MEKTEITELIRSMTTVSDLASILNSIKKSEFSSVKYYSISESMLRYFSSDSIAPKRFRAFKIRKKSGGFRVIKAPCQQLDVILSCVNFMLKAIYTPSDVSMGFTTGRSVLDNAQLHIGHNYVFNIDLKDFFPSISQARVWKRLQLSPFNFSKKIASVLAGLCCSYDEKLNVSALPQGSPASPLLTNAICDKLDRRMKGVAKRFGLHYSRYADDMTFSSMHNVYQEEGEFRIEIQRIISEQGFRINDSKTRLQKIGSRQEVTGLTVNTIPNVTRKYISDLRWILCVWEREGYAKAYAMFYPKYKYEKGYIKKGEPILENVIGGKLNYLRMVRGIKNTKYKRLQERFDKLQQGVFSRTKENQTKSEKFMYIQAYTMAEFENYFGTKVTLTITPKGKLVGCCIIAGMRKILAISHSTQDYLCSNLKNTNPGFQVQSDELDKCNVILCRVKCKNYWLIAIRNQERVKSHDFQDI